MATTYYTFNKLHVPYYEQQVRNQKHINAIGEFEN